VPTIAPELVVQTVTARTRTAEAATRAAQPTPNASETAIAAAEQAAARAEETAAARETCLMGPNVPQDWSFVICDPFSSNIHGWSVEPVENDFLAGNRAVANGKYRWDFTSKRGVVARVPLRVVAGRDFYLSVVVQKLAGDPSAAYGLSFRLVEGSYYLLTVWEDGRYDLSAYVDEDWVALATGSDPDAMHPGQPNRLTVEGQGPHFAVYLNDKRVAIAQDDRLPQGTVGIAISFSEPDTSETLEFDDFVLLQPTADSRPRSPIAALAQPPASSGQPTVGAPPPASGTGCNLAPGNAGILVVNQFDGLMTFTILNREYKLEPHTEQLVQIRGGEPFTVSVSVAGVGQTSFGPLSLAAGSCEFYRPNAE
jgi:hypothetical protein